MKKGCVNMSNKNSFLKVELLQQYDIINQVYVEDRNIKLDMLAIQHGLIKEIGATEFAVLMAIASFTDVEGQAFPSQRKLVEVTGLSLPTINKIVNKLLATEINGVPVLAREFEQTRNKRNFSVYTLNTVKQENEESNLKVVFQETTEAPTVEKPKKKTSRDYSNMFKALYEQEYGISYIISYARDNSLIKNKLMGNFTEEEIVELIEFIIKNYRTKWAKPSFPYPTISMVCGWLGNTAMQMIKEQKDKEKEIEMLEEVAMENLETSIDVLDLI